MMSHQKNNSRRNYHYVSMIPFLLLVFSLYSFKTYNFTFPYTIDTNSTNDSIPIIEEEIDTIITLDPKTYKETVRIIKTKKDLPPIDDLQIIQMNPEIIPFSDTIVTLDLENYEEKVQVIKGKMIKGYKILIDREYAKPNPDFKKIDKWRRDGKRD